MKKIFAIALAILFCASIASADEVDEGLSSMASEQLRARTRQMIRCGIDRKHAIKMTRNMLMNQFGEEHALRAQRMIMNAKEERLPVGPIMEKAHEGMAKGVPAEQILQAMQKVHDRYSHAHRHAKGISREEGDIHRMRNMIAQCLAAGLHDEDVGNIAYKLQQRAQDDVTKAEVGELATEAFRAARDMARLGATSVAVTDTVWQALDRRYGTKDMKTMRDSFVTNIRYASSASNLAGSYADSISRGEGPEMLWSSSRIGAAGTRRAMRMGPSGSGGTGVSGSGGGTGSGGSGSSGGGVGSGGSSGSGSGPGSGGSSGSGGGRGSGGGGRGGH
jgi:hypothetical protein